MCYPFLVANKTDNWLTKHQRYYLSKADNPVLATQPHHKGIIVKLAQHHKLDRGVSQWLFIQLRLTLNPSWVWVVRVVIWWGAAIYPLTNKQDRLRVSLQCISYLRYLVPGIILHIQRFRRFFSLSRRCSHRSLNRTLLRWGRCTPCHFWWLRWPYYSRLLFTHILKNEQLRGWCLRSNAEMGKTGKITGVDIVFLLGL